MTLKMCPINESCRHKFRMKLICYLGGIFMSNQVRKRVFILDVWMCASNFGEQWFKTAYAWHNYSKNVFMMHFLHFTLPSHTLKINGKMFHLWHSCCFVTNRAFSKKNASEQVLESLWTLADRHDTVNLCAITLHPMCNEFGFTHSHFSNITAKTIFFFNK